MAYSAQCGAPKAKVKSTLTNSSLTDELRQLRTEVQRLRRERDDLEIALLTAIEHGDAIQHELQIANRQLQAEVQERVTLEKELRLLIDTVRQESQDLAAVLEAITEHSDQVEQHWHERYVQTETAANSDPLTGLANRRVFDQAIAHQWRYALHSHKPLALIVGDIDCFKPFNDNYGHQKGDECLVQVAGVFQRAARRDDDVAARYGGEEFVLLLPHTDLLGARKIADAILQDMRQLALPHAYSIVTDHITVSLGLCSTIPEHPDECALFAAADRQLYLAKHRGRNRCEMTDTAPPLSSSPPQDT